LAEIKYNAGLVI